MKKHNLWHAVTLMMLCCTALAGRAQEVFVPRQAQFLTRFSFTMLTGGVVVVRAALDNYSDSLNFILDTGSGGISLDSTTVARLGIRREPSERTIRGIAGIRKVDFANNHRLNFPGLRVDSLNFHINDYSLLTGIYGMRIDGIAGFSLLSRYIIKLNYDRNIMEMYTPGEIKYPRGGQVITPAISGLPMYYSPIEDATKRLARFYLDTGAGLCLLLSRDFVDDSTLISSHRKRYLTIGEGLGGKKEMELTVVKSFRFGNYRFKNVPTYIFDDDFNVTQYPFLGGLIGNDLLRKFNLIINYPDRQIHVLPNTHFREPFDYAYTGMGLFATPEGIFIADVVRGSPADKAGLKDDDLIVSIGNDLSGNMQTYKTLLQDADNTVRVIVNRGNQLVEAKVKVTNIRSKKRR